MTQVNTRARAIAFVGVAAKTLISDDFGTALFFIGALFFLAPQVIGSAGLLVFFGLGPGQRQPF